MCITMTEETYVDVDVDEKVDALEVFGEGVVKKGEAGRRHS